MSRIRAFRGDIGVGVVGSSVPAVECLELGDEVLESDERTWLMHHCQGDRWAFPALLDAYGPRVHGYVVRCGVVDVDREDVCQTVFLKIHAAAATYDSSYRSSALAALTWGSSSTRLQGKCSTMFTFANRRPLSQRPLRRASESATPAAFTGLCCEIDDRATS